MLFLVTPLFSILHGGRSTLVIVFGMMAVTVLILLPRLSRRTWIMGGLGTLTIFAATMVTFLMRIDDSGISIDQVVRDAGFTQLLPVSDAGLAFLDSAPNWLAMVTFYLLSVAQYTVHGVFEFFVLLREKSQFDEGLLWGRYEFFLIDQLFRFIDPEGAMANLELYNTRSGVFTTFWGPAFIDFGYLGTIVFSFLFGLVAAFFRARVAVCDLFALPLYVLLVVQIAMMPIANAIQASGLLYYDLGLFALWLLAWGYFHMLGRGGSRAVPSELIGRASSK